VPARTLVVLNPSSRSGGVRRRWARLERQLREALGPLEVEQTSGPGSARRLAREGARAGVERLVVAGGDGTLSEVASGVLEAGLGHRVEIGVLPLGTGSDLARSLGVARSTRAAIEVLARGVARSIDAGRVEYQDRDGRPAATWFANIASFGISASVVERVNRGPKGLIGRAAFGLATLPALAAYRCQSVAIRVDGECVHEGPLVLCAVANGRYFGGGMHVAPRARLDDALLDVVVVPEFSRLGLVRRLPSLYRGTHLDRRVAWLYRGKEVVAEPTAGEVWLEVDGERLGALPARFGVQPAALRVLGPPA
jgi:YegS/Rv2252/BmrU family lipid kinase